MITLALDASTYAGSVALLHGMAVLEAEHVPMRDAARERLMPAVAAVLDRSGVDRKAIERIVCGRGPGSFTSLRIAGGIAKGLAMGVPCPLFDVSSLALLVAAAQAGEGRYLGALDALRGDCYVGLYEVASDQQVREVERPRLVPIASLEGLAVECSARIVTPMAGADRIQATPDAAALARCAVLLADAGPVDIRSWQPEYGRLAEAQVRWESAHGRPLADA